MKNFRAIAMPGGEQISTNAQQREQLRKLLNTDNLEFSHVIAHTRRWHQVMSALVESGILRDSQWRR